MKRTVLVLLLAVSCVFASVAQDTVEIDFSTLSDTFQTFSETVGPSLAFNTAIGLSWSSAYIGQLFAIPPHLGVGVTAGATMVPFDGVNDMIEALGLQLNPDRQATLDELGGLPLPSMVFDARVGGLIFPFDIGLKAMQVTPEILESVFEAASMPDIDFEYTNVGADIRFAVVKQNFFLPNISIGAGVNYLKGFVTLPLDNAPSMYMDIIEPLEGGGSISEQLYITPKSMGVSWESQVYEAKVQLSKSILWLVTPYIGGAISMSKSTVGGGYASEVTLGNNPLDDQDIEYIKNYLESQGIDVPDELSRDGMFYEFPVETVSARIFGGVSLNILLLKIDGTIHYDVGSGAYGASLGVRVQL